MKKSMALFSLIALVGCGGDGTDLSSTELVKDVSLVPYHLKKVKIEAEFIFANGTTEFHETEIFSAKGQTKDTIVKSVENDRFVLYINSEKSGVHVAASGEIDYKRQPDFETLGCRLDGLSKVNGRAIHNKFDLTWDMDIELKGEGCPDSIVEKYLDFQNEEVEALNLITLDDLLEPLKDDMAKTVRVKLKVQLSGDSE